MTATIPASLAAVIEPAGYDVSTIRNLEFEYLLNNEQGALDGAFGRFANGANGSREEGAALKLVGTYIANKRAGFCWALAGGNVAVIVKSDRAQDMREAMARCAAFCEANGW